MSDREALLCAVLHDPEDDTVRLVYADYLQENGEYDEAEFIRADILVSQLIAGRIIQTPDNVVECATALIVVERNKRERTARLHEQLVSEELGVVGLCIYRGFVDHVTCKLGVLFGSECLACHKSNGRQRSRVKIVCSTCDGNQRVDGIAKKLFAKYPITRVTLTDREAHRSPHDGRWEWSQGRFRRRHGLPTELWSLLCDYEADSDVFTRRYPTESAAADAVSEACVSLGRKLAKVDS